MALCGDGRPYKVKYKVIDENAYFDHQTNIPVVSASSYPTSTNDFGVSLKFSLTRYRKSPPVSRLVGMLTFKNI